MGATFGRKKIWGEEVLTYTDLNGEFDNVLDNLDPSGVDDCSATIADFGSTKNPYPGGAPSLPISLQEEIKTLRYAIGFITGSDPWYVLKATAHQMYGDGGITKMFFYNNTAPTGWVIDESPADCLLAVKQSSTTSSSIYVSEGGKIVGTWVIGGIKSAEHVLTVDEMPPHTHTAKRTNTHNEMFCNANASWAGDAASTDAYTSVTGGGQPHIHNVESDGTWRPLAAVGIIATLAETKEA